MANTEEERILDIKVRYDDAIKAIANYKAKIDTLKAAEKELGKEVRNGQITMGEYNKSIAANDAVMTQYKDNMRVLRKELQNNIRQEQEMEGSLKQLRAELSNATKAYDELSRSERNGAKGNELQQHIKDITKELKGAEEATDRFYRNVGNYKNSIAEALTGNSQFASSLLKLSQDGGGIQGLFSNITGSVKAFGTALMGLLANPIFLGIAGIAGAGAAFKWWYGYNDGLIKASKLTSSFTGTQGAEMKTLRSEIQAVADTFGLDFSETLKTANALVQNYGLSWQDAISKVKDGLLMGGSILPEYSQYIQQYAGAFKDLGINANQLVGVMTQIGKSGINANTALQSINRGGYSLQKMSATLKKDLEAAGIDADDLSKRIQSGQVTTIQAMQEVTRKLEKQGVTSKNTAVVMQDLFGKGAINLGSQFLKVLNNIGTGIDQIKSKASETQKLRDATIKKQSELNNTVAAMFDMTGGGFEKMKAQMKYVAVNSLLSIAKAVVRVINYFIDWYNESTLVRTLVQGIATDFKLLWNTVKVVFNLIIDAVKGVGRQLKGMADIVEGIVTLSFDKIKQGFSAIGSNIGKTFKEGLGDVKAFATSSAKDVVDGINNVFGKNKIKHIEVPVSGENTSPLALTASNVGGSTTGSSEAKSGSEGKNSKNNSAAKQVEEQAKAEREAMQKAQELLIKLIDDNFEQRRAAINANYDKQINDIKEKIDKGTNLTANTVQAYYSQIGSLEQLRDRELTALKEEEIRKQVEQENRRISLLLDAAKKGSEDEKNLKLEQLKNQEQLDLASAENEIHNKEQLEEMKLAIQKSYASKREQVEIASQKAAQEAQLTAIQDEYSQKINAARDNELTQLQLKMEQRKAILDMAQQQEDESIEAFNARKLRLEEDYQSSLQAVQEKQLEVEKAKASVITSLFSGLSDVADAFGENSKTLARASKVLALGEIAVSSGVAVAQGIKQAQSVPFPENIAAIATTVSTILSGIASAIKTVKSAKFARGGYVSGAGSGTSDSIPARLSNGESVMTASATSLFAPALSAFNQLGGGVPIIVNSPQQQLGGEFIAAAVARGMQMSPRPVVSVEEISDTKKRIETIENISMI